MRGKNCSQYDSQSGNCLSGWPVVSGVCFGIVIDGCKSCGLGASIAPCMREENGPAFVGNDGLPIDWPLRDSPNNRRE